MIRVSIELWKGGNPNDRVFLGGMDICNIGGSATRGNYKIYQLDNNQRRQRRAVPDITNYPRNAVSVFNLVTLALRQLGWVEAAEAVRRLRMGQ